MSIILRVSVSYWNSVEYDTLIALDFTIITCWFQSQYNILTCLNKYPMRDDLHLLCENIHMIRSASSGIINPQIKSEICIRVPPFLLETDIRMISTASRIYSGMCVLSKCQRRPIVCVQAISNIHKYYCSIGGGSLLLLVGFRINRRWVSAVVSWFPDDETSVWIANLSALHHSGGQPCFRSGSNYFRVYLFWVKEMILF